MNRDQFLTAALRNPVNEIISEELLRRALPDAWIVAGCLVQTVWNGLTRRAVDYGINDYDVFYFDPDTTWAAEDAVIRQLHDAFANLGVSVEIRKKYAIRRASISGIPKSTAYPTRRCILQRKASTVS